MMTTMCSKPNFKFSRQYLVNIIEDLVMCEQKGLITRLYWAHHGLILVCPSFQQNLYQHFCLNQQCALKLISKHPVPYSMFAQIMDSLGACKLNSILATLNQKDALHSSVSQQHHSKPNKELHTGCICHYLVLSQLRALTVSSLSVLCPMSSNRDVPWELRKDTWLFYYTEL